MKRLVVFANRRLNELRRRALRLDELNAAGLSAEYWDLDPVFRYYPHEPSEVSRPYVRRFDAWAQAEAALAEPGMADAVIVPTFLHEDGFYGAFRRLSRCPAALAVPRLYSSPVPARSAAASLAGRLRALARPQTLRTALLKRGMLALRRLGLIRGFDLAFTVGEVPAASSRGLPRVPIHHPDFDDWRSEEASDKPPFEGRYAVFLDQFYAGHPDHAIEGLPPVDAARYFRTLNALFARLEGRHRLEVVIAAHPKADYARNPFEGRKVLRSSTRALTRFSEFALTTFSASMSYAVFGRKPLFFIDSDEMAVVHRPSGQQDWPRMYAEVLGGRHVNLDHPSPDDELVRAPDAAVYDRYKYRHLVSRENEGRSTADVLAAFLRGAERPA